MITDDDLTILCAVLSVNGRLSPKNCLLVGWPS
jgi:hypothetical protein